jgi:16S rRNA (uracil1498-N3)-methyltransferase
MPHLFFVAEIPSGNRLVVSDNEAHHAINVLRVETGEEVLISDGRGNWVSGSIGDITRKNFEVNVKDRSFQELSKPKLTVLQGIPKSDRLKEAIELMVEAGVDEIIPWSATRSIAKWQKDSKEKWLSAAIASAKQAKRFHIPKIGEEVEINEFLNSRHGSFAVIVLHETGGVKLSKIISEKMLELDEIVLVVGPEGGITDNELSLFEKAGARVAQMGETVFRSAHAGGFSLAAISTLLGRW